MPISQASTPRLADEKPIANIPPISEQRIALRVSRNAERQLRQGHPWLFEQAIQHQNRSGCTGDLAVIFDSKRRFLAIGLYDADATIRVRVLHSGDPQTIDEHWIAQKIATAATQRDPIRAGHTDGYRVVHGENDGLPGLVIDRYADTLVVKLYTAAWIPHLRTLLPLLPDAVRVPAVRVVLRLSRQVQHVEGALFGLADGMALTGDLPDETLTFTENGLRFEVDPIRGQKTGFFLDQRDNRAQVEALSAGRRVLNIFAYTGGFSLYAARGGAREVASLDVSRPALDAAQRNFALNSTIESVRTARHETVRADAFRWLADARASGRRFDMVILDPPAFAKRKSEVAGALDAYSSLIGLGLDLLEPNGTLVAASCSSRISADEFFGLVHRAGMTRGRSLRELMRTGHALDHPIGFPQGAYLKCLFARVD